MSSSHGNPLQIPELRAHISQFVTLDSALQCVQVCHAWYADFAARIWHTIDLSVHKRFCKQNQSAVMRLGHRIRSFKNVRELYQVEFALHAGLYQLENFEIKIEATSRVLASLHDFLRINSTTLNHVALHFLLSEEALSPYSHFPLDGLTLNPNEMGHSNLTRVKFYGLAMTRTAFSRFLERCPLLTIVSIKEVAIYGASWAGHRHRRVQQIHASPNQICNPDPHNATAPSLLVNFPNITHWQVDAQTSRMKIPNDTIKNEVIRYCPRLRSVSLRSKGTFAVEMLVHVFENLHDLVIFSKDLTSDVVMSMLAHQKTLTRIHVIDNWKHGNKETDGTAGSDLVCASSWIVQMLPQICSNLRSLKIPGHAMDIAEIEKASWSCDRLETLHIKVRGLDSAGQIDQAIQMWLSRKNKRKRKNRDDLHDEMALAPDTIETRVARHLLKFEHLSSVWLGNKVHGAKGFTGRYQ